MGKAKAVCPFHFPSLAKNSCIDCYVQQICSDLAQESDTSDHKFQMEGYADAQFSFANCYMPICRRNQNNFHFSLTYCNNIFIAQLILENFVEQVREKPLRQML